MASLWSQDAQGLNYKHNQDLERDKNFLVITGHRTGSSMVLALLDSNPNITKPNPAEPYSGYKHSGQCLNFNLTLEDCFKYLRSVNPTAQTIAFKVHWDTLPNIKEPFGSPNITYVLHNRRNVVRTMVAFPSGLHAGNPYEAADGAFKTALQSNLLVREIRDYFAVHASLWKMLGSSKICYSWFENWIDPRARNLQQASLEKCLGLPYRELHENEEPIQEVYPILDTIVNSKDVENALRGTEFEYMLEDAALNPRPRIVNASGVEYAFMDEASRNTVFDNLKASDALYAQGCGKNLSNWRHIAARLSKRLYSLTASPFHAGSTPVIHTVWHDPA